MTCSDQEVPSSEKDIRNQNLPLPALVARFSTQVDDTCHYVSRHHLSHRAADLKDAPALTQLVSAVPGAQDMLNSGIVSAFREAWKPIFQINLGQLIV